MGDDGAAIQLWWRKGEDSEPIGTDGAHEMRDRPKNRKRCFECCGTPSSTPPTRIITPMNKQSLPLRQKVKRRMRWKIRNGILLWLLSTSRTVEAEPFRSCLEHLQRADSDNNNELSGEEFRSAVLSLSGGQEPGTALANVLANGVMFVSDTQDAGLQELCINIHVGILEDATHKMDIQVSRCLFAMAIGDSDRDSSLRREQEYPRYANQVSSNQFGFSTPFATLPNTVQDVFDDFRDSTTDTIDITGAKSTETLSENVEKELFNLCLHTAIAVLAANTPDEPEKDPLVVEPSEPPPAVEPPREATSDDSYEPTFSFTICTRMMAFSDLSRDTFLSQDEYLMFVNRLSSTSFTDLPPSLADAFSTLSSDGLISVDGSKPGQDSSLFEESLSTICRLTDLGIQQAQSNPLPPPATEPAGKENDQSFEPTFTFATCTRMMAFSDTSRDNRLDDDEFFQFVNRLSSNAYNGDYSGLPDSLQNAFGSLSTGGLVDITGSKPGQDKSAYEDVLANICEETDKAIQAGSLSPTEVEPEQGPAPGPSPPPDDFQPSFTFPTCTRMMAFSDVSRDGSLDEAEYFRFINRLVTEPFRGSFDSLPASLQNAFSVLSIDSSIDIAGSRPGENVADNQENLEKICTVTDTAIQTAASDEDTPIGEATPTPIDTPDRSIEYSKCLRDMIIADNTRDGKLNENEYVRFVSRNDDRYETTTAFSALSASLQTNFESLAGSDNLIDVTGSRPGQDVDEEAEEKLKKICQATGEALAIRGPTAAPTGLVSGDTMVLNAILVSNLMGLRADSLTYILDDLETAYDALVREALVNYTENESFLEEVGSGRHRSLAITKIGLRPTINSLRDIFCPDFAITTNELCAVAFASFGIEFENELGTEQVAASLSAYVQDRISPYMLNELLIINPNITVKVEGPFSPVDPTRVDFPNFSDGPSGDWSSGVSVGQVVAGSVVFLLLIGTTVYCCKSQKLVSKLFKSKSEGIGPSDRGNDSDAEKMETGSRYDQSNSGNESRDQEDSDGSGDDESVSFSVQDEETTQRDKAGGDNIFNVFQLGKKKAANAADDINILESGTDGGLDEDFGDYNFDEPTELQQGKINKSSTFSSTWGQTESSEWGGNEWTGGANTTFEDQTKDSDSDDDDDDDDSFSHEASSQDGSISKSSGGSGQIGQFEGMVDNGDWSDVMKATKFGSNFDASFTSRRSHEEPSLSESSNGSSHSSPTPRAETSDPKKGTPTSMSSEERRRQSEFRGKVEELVRRAAPEELDNIPSMMEKFLGREDELLTTLETMYARSSSNRNFKGVHKSRGIRERDSRVTNNGNAEGSAVIAAACMLNSDNPADFDDDSSYSDDRSYRSGSRSGSRSRSGSYSGDRSFTDDRSFTGSHSGSRSGSYDSRRSDEEYGEGSFTGSRSGSFSQGSHSRRSGSFSGRGSREDYSQGSGSYSRSHSGSYRSGSYRSGEHSGSYRSDEGSYRSGDGSYRSGEGSYRSGEGSYRSGEGSYRSGEGSYRSGEGSFRSPSGSYRSPSGSYRSPSGSYRSPSGSYRSGEGSYRSSEGSYRSDEGSYRSGDASYRSGDGSYRSGSYRSGEGSFDSRRSGSGSYSGSPSGSYSRSPSGSYNSRSPTGSYRSPGEEDNTDYGYG